jgi:putative NADH-flavin reductase
LEAERMKITVFGANGRTGSQVVERALAAGHEVVAVGRRPESIRARDRLVVKKGDVLEPDSVALAVAGAQAVISTIGPANNSQPGTLISVGTKNIVDACERGGVRRFVMESGMITSDRTELSLLGRWVLATYAALFPKLRADKLVAEATVRQSKLEWVIVRPPLLNQGPATGKYLAGPRMRILPPKAISHADCAHVLIKAATESAWVKQIINVGRA